MNPHFIYNALISIQDYVGANDEYILLCTLGELQVDAKTLNNSQNKTITNQKESRIFNELYLY
jgi:hypothetical protein